MDARIRQDFEERAYRVYISDGLYASLKCYKERYIDFSSFKEKEPEETGDQIIARVMKDGGLHFEDEETS